jgi:hypothetical protein
VILLNVRDGKRVYLGRDARVPTTSRAAVRGWLAALLQARAQISIDDLVVRRHGSGSLDFPGISLTIAYPGGASHRYGGKMGVDCARGVIFFLAAGRNATG